MQALRLFRSLRSKMILWAFVFVVPILLILYSSIQMASSSYKTQITANISHILSPYVATVDATLNTAKRFTAGLDKELSAYNWNAQDELTALNQMQQIGNTLSTDLTLYPDIDAIFIYRNADMSFVQNYGQSYVMNAKAADALCDILSEHDSDKPIYQLGYQHFQVGDEYYIYIGANFSDGIAGCWFNIDSLFGDIAQAKIDGLEQVCLASASGRMLNASFNTPSSKQLSGLLAPYLVTSAPLSSASFEVKGLWDKSIVLLPVVRMQRAVIISISIAALLFLLYLLFLHTSLIRPLNRLTGYIKNIQKGDLNPVPVRSNESVEIANVCHALNNMTSQIENLKIEMYEEKLNKQKTQMQLFQLQIRPHFFLNALNTIISFARIQEYDMVQKMTIYLATHFRYILYNSWHVSVEEELVYTQNFIDMQSAQHGGNYRYHVHAPDEVLDYEIPILAIQIFVENSIKYSSRLEHPIEIHVNIAEVACADAAMLSIDIDDNGCGFDEETLHLLNQSDPESIIDENHGIGIANVRQRLKILYSDAALLSISNNDHHGAHIHMLLPIDHQKGGVNHEA